MGLRIRTYSELDGQSSDLADQVGRQQERVGARLSSVARVLGVMSGKGGVGKSLLTAALASSFARRGLRVGVIDADVNGPSLVRMLGVTARPLESTPGGVEPERSPDGVALMSMALLVDEDAAIDWHEPDEAGFVWRGALERGALREFLSDVAWGELDVLLVDLPPGTQRLVELHELVPDLAGVVTVTIPSGASRDAVSRSLELGRRRGLHMLGVVENMSGYRCADCGQIGALHEGDAATDLAERFDLPVLARLPMDIGLGRAAEAGKLASWLSGDAATAIQLDDLAGRVLDGLAMGEDSTE
ncbi:MAG: Mrp/NBP35 family ATP-binding protein [Gemmatimonadota bacterium]|nr:Mrp/NBP35 family ATP-binding protein [Gemmatimonadota bacterium]